MDQVEYMIKKSLGSSDIASKMIHDHRKKKDHIERTTRPVEKGLARYIEEQNDEFQKSFKATIQGEYSVLRELRDNIELEIAKNFDDDAVKDNVIRIRFKKDGKQHQLFLNKKELAQAI